MHRKYSVIIHKRVEKFLSIHPEMSKSFFQILDILSEDIQTRKVDIKSLSWLSGNHFRFRIWKYRFLYEVLEDKICIYVYNAGSRWNIYK